jgi:16S rRNA (guanine527-N7)-methyltransferase
VEQSLYFPSDPRTTLLQGAEALGVPISTHVAARMILYLKELMRWNTKVNLTGTKDEVEVVGRHILDALAAFRIFAPRSGLQVLDIGTGAGFPGLVWKLQAPNLQVTLLEPAAKKAAFLHHIRGLLGPSDLEIVMKRVQDFQENKTFHLITSRALKIELLSSAASRFLAPGGRLLIHGVGPLLNPPTGYTLDREFSYRLPFFDIPRTLSLLRLSHDAAPTALPRLLPSLSI